MRNITSLVTALACSAAALAAGDDNTGNRMRQHCNNIASRRHPETNHLLLSGIAERAPMQV
jgi:hypothetical protein